jgi:hypothetical protein
VLPISLILVDVALQRCPPPELFGVAMLEAVTEMTSYLRALRRTVNVVGYQNEKILVHSSDMSG